MKKVTYLLLLMFATVLLTTSCEKDESITPEEKLAITTEDLVGDWDFYSFTYQGRTVYDCDAEFNRDWNWVTMNLENVTTSHLKIYTDCMDADDNMNSYEITLEYSIEKENGKFILYMEGGRKFEILNVDSFDGTELKLKLIYSTSLSLCVGAEYVFNKR